MILNKRFTNMVNTKDALDIKHDHKITKSRLNLDSYILNTVVRAMGDDKHHERLQLNYFNNLNL